MATKYVVIPEDMYKSLVQDRDEKKSKIGLSLAEASVEKVKRSKQKNLSSKNVLYNQELRRYLKTRKEELDKPIKVELSNGGKELVTKPSLIQQQQSGSRKRPQHTISESNADDGFEYDEEDFVPGGQFVLPTPRQITTPGPLTRQLRQQAKTPKDTRKDRILELLRQNPQKYNIDKYDNILNNNGKPIKGSNVEDTLERLINPSVTNAPSPPGSKVIENIIRRDDEIRTIYNESPPFQQKRGHQKSYMYTPHPQKGQHGTGGIKKHKYDKLKSVFKPQLWT